MRRKITTIYDNLLPTMECESKSYVSSRSIVRVVRKSNQMTTVTNIVVSKYAAEPKKNETKKQHLKLPPRFSIGECTKSNETVYIHISRAVFDLDLNHTQTQAHSSLAPYTFRR